MRIHGLRKLAIVLAALCLGVAILSIYAIRGRQEARAHALFRQYIMGPIPASVAQIRADQARGASSYRCVLRFAIDKTDVELIRRSRPFREARITGYMGGGSLWWDWKDFPSSGGEKSRAFGVYGSDAPSWYDLESWDNPETYILVKEDKSGNTSEIQVLMYNSASGYAFFIIVSYSNRVPFF
jgi:hypothetical protein